MALLFILIGLMQIGLLVWALRLYRNSPNCYAFLTLPTLAFLAYDNFVIAAGASIGAGETLKSLNALRFYAHALLTPLLIIFAFGVARRAGIGWAQSRRNYALFCLLATALLLFGVYIDIINLTLELKEEFGLLRYVNVFFKGPPIPAIVTIIVPGVAAGSIVVDAGRFGLDVHRSAGRLARTEFE